MSPKPSKQGPIEGDSGANVPADDGATDAFVYDGATDAFADDGATDAPASPNVNEPFAGPSHPNGCPWDLHSWLAELDTTLAAAEGCDPVARPPGVTLSDQAQCFEQAREAAGSSANTPILSARGPRAQG